MLRTPDFSKSVATANRRRSQRYPVSASLKYFANDEYGEGHACNIGSGGLLCRLPCPPPVGTKINLWIDWPVLLNDRVPLCLAVRGKVLRKTFETTAIKISSYEFKLKPMRTRVKSAVYLFNGAASA